MSDRYLLIEIGIGPLQEDATHYNLPAPVDQLAEQLTAIALSDSARAALPPGADVDVAAMFRTCEEADRAERPTRSIEEIHANLGHYTSTYCIHDRHQSCRLTCKICNRPCQCRCHDPHSVLPSVRDASIDTLAEHLLAHAQRFENLHHTHLKIDANAARLIAAMAHEVWADGGTPGGAGTA